MQTPPSGAPVDALINKSLISDVQYNCDISDARYARDATMCVYLLRMREFYRWRHDISLGIRLSLEDVGDWLTDTEQHWDQIEHEAYRSITVGDDKVDPFDCDRVGALLEAQNIPLVYTAGVGRRGKPHFVLAQSVGRYTERGTRIDVCGRELARDIVAQPAMSRQQSIWVRDDSVRRLLWELFEDWSFHSKDGPMARIAADYDLQHDDDLNNRLGALALDVREVIVAHEGGEVQARQHLPESWGSMIEKSLGASNEIFARAARDHLADSLVTWPLIVDRAQPRLLDFWLCGLNGAREAMFKTSPFSNVLSATSDADRLKILQNSADASAAYWSTLANRFAEQFAADGATCDFAAIADEFSSAT